MKTSLGFLILLLIYGCNKAIEKPKKPDNLISEATMVNIMYDAFLLNSAKGINKRMLENNGIYPEHYIFEKYNIDSTQFANSNNYYAYDIKTYESILSRLREKIEADKRKYEALDELEEAERKRKADSLKEVRARERDSVIKIGKEKPLKVIEDI
jgi:hypothetical protein